MRNNKIAGFSLIEIVVSLAAISVLAAMATPQFIGFVAAQSVRSDAENVQRFLQEAQSEAKKQSQELELRLADCTTDSECESIQKKWVLQAQCEATIQALNPSNKLLWEMYQTGSMIVFEDGTCGLVWNPSERQKPLAQSVSEGKAPMKKGES